MSGVTTPYPGIQIEDRILMGAIQFMYRHIRIDETTLSRMSTNEVFALFDERRYHATAIRRIDPVLISSASDTSEAHIATFIITILQEGLFSVRSLVVAIIYLSRFKEVTKVSLHSYSWRLLFITSLLVADKTYDDQPIRVKSLAKLFPVVTPSELCELELNVCLKTRFTLIVNPKLYDSFIEKLIKEIVTREVREIVEELCLDPTVDLPLTPQTIVKRAGPRGEVKKAPVVIAEQPTRRGRTHSVSLSRALSVSSFIDDCSMSSSCSKRRASTGRTQHVPEPPAFDEFAKPIMRGFAVNRLCRDPSQDPVGWKIQHQESSTYPFEKTLRDKPNYRRESPQRASPRWNAA